jgi:hypothetical protein
MLKKLLKQLSCSHNFKFLRNIYGDEIWETGGRSWWICTKCKMRRIYRNLIDLPDEYTEMIDQAIKFEKGL